jgi:hypothetical protein
MRNGNLQRGVQGVIVEEEGRGRKNGCAGLVFINKHPPGGGVFIDKQPMNGGR